MRLAACTVLAAAASLAGALSIVPRDGAQGAPSGGHGAPSGGHGPGPEMSAEQGKCHFDCGILIRIRRENQYTYCSNDTWVQHYEDCMCCAPKYPEHELWTHYKPNSGSAIKKCNLKLFSDEGYEKSASCVAKERVEECRHACKQASNPGSPNDYCNEDEWNRRFKRCQRCGGEPDIVNQFREKLTPLARACGKEAFNTLATRSVDMDNDAHELDSPPDEEQEGDNDDEDDNDDENHY